MPKRKPTGYFTEGKGFDRTVHPTFNPTGLRIPKHGPGSTQILEQRIANRTQKKEYPDLRNTFKVGDQVKTHYQAPGEKRKDYVGTVKRVGKDYIDVVWQPSGRETRSWDWAVFEGSGYTGKVTKVANKPSEKWTKWKKEGDGLYVRTKGQYPAIQGETQFKFTKGIDRRKTGYGDVLTTRQRALDWRKGSHKTKFTKISKVRKVKDGYVYTVKVFAGTKVRGRKTLEDYKITFYYSKGRQETVKTAAKDSDDALNVGLKTRKRKGLKPIKIVVKDGLGALLGKVVGHAAGGIHSAISSFRTSYAKGATERAELKQIREESHAEKKAWVEEKSKQMLQRAKAGDRAAQIWCNKHGIGWEEV